MKLHEGCRSLGHWSGLFSCSSAKYCSVLYGVRLLVEIVFRFWFFKVIAMVGLCIGVFFIEGESASEFAFGIFFYYLCVFLM